MIDSIFEEIRAERKRRNEKWGEQNHPMLGKYLTAGKGRSEIKFPSKTLIKNQLENCCHRLMYDKNWFDILLEEVCGAFLETEPERQREEMIQVAAVAVNIIECLDRRKI